MHLRLTWFAFAIFWCAPLAADDPPAADSKKSSLPAVNADATRRLELEKKFEQSLSGATLIGHFTMLGKAPAAAPQEEKYTLQKVSKLKDDLWLFQARIQYGDHDVTVPLPLKVLWAGDTPVITLDKLPVPGLGTFTARVLIYDDQYAGTWSGGDHGGQLFGRITRPEAEKK